MRRLTVFVLLLLTARLAAAAPATPEKRAEAKVHYENGLRKFDVGKYDEAAEEFQAAYEIVGDPVILYNIAQSFRVAQKYDKALLFYKNYLRRTGNPGNRAEVEQRIAEITAVIEQQKKATEAPPTGPIKSEPPEKPPEPEPKAGVKPVEPPPPLPPPGPPKNARTLKITGIALLAVTAVSLGVGIGMSVTAGQASSDVEAAARSRVEFTPELRNKDTDGRTFDVVGIAFYAVAGVCAVAGGVTLGLGLKGERAARASILPVLGRDTAGVAISGRF